MWRDVSELVRPVRAFWRCLNDNVLSTISIDVDLRLNASTNVMLERWLDTIWISVWAPLLQSSTLCTSYGIVPYTLTGPAISIVPENRLGIRPGIPAGIESAGVWNAWGGGFATSTERRLYVAFIPQGDIADRQLTDSAVARHLTAARSLLVGCNGDVNPAAPQLIIWRRSRAAIGTDPFRPPGWLPCVQLIVNTYVDKAPEPV